MNLIFEFEFELELELELELEIEIELVLELDFSNFILNSKTTIEINLSLPFVKAQYEV